MTDSNTDNFTPQTKRMRRVRLWAIALLGLILFIAGGAVGGGTSTIIILNSLHHKTYNSRWATHKITMRLQRRLDLTRAQTNKINHIVETHQHNIKEFRHSAHQNIETQLQQMRDEIAQVLTEKQRKKWVALFNRMHRRWSPRHHQKRYHHNHKAPRKSRQSHHAPLPDSQKK